MTVDIAVWAKFSEAKHNPFLRLADDGSLRFWVFDGELLYHKDNDYCIWVLKYDSMLDCGMTVPRSWGVASIQGFSVWVRFINPMAENSL